MVAIRQGRTLTAEQIETFERDGFLVLGRVLEDEHVARLSRTLDDLLARDLSRRTPDFVVDRNSTTALRNINHFTKYWIGGEGLITQPVVLGAIGDLLGDDVRFHHTKVFLKPPFEGTAKEWHQDFNSYVDDAERERLRPMGRGLSFRDVPLIAAQYYLDDSTESNGCLQFVPGSHTWGLLGKIDDNTRADRYPADQVVKAPAPAGSAVLFHALTLHYSSPNQSPNPRRAPIVQYFAPPSAVNLRPYAADTPFGERLL